MFDKIMVPVDGSEASGRAVKFASDLASRYGAEVIVLHVCEHEYIYGVDVLPERLDEATELVDGYVRTMKDAGLSPEARGVGAVWSLCQRDPRRCRRRAGGSHRDGHTRPICLEPPTAR